MSKVSITRSKLDSLANTIAAKSGVPAPMTITEMQTAVAGISPSPTLQTVTKSYTPTETAITEAVTAGSGYDGIDTVNVTVGAIDSNYVGSGVTRKAAATYTPTTSAQTIASGQYLTGAQTIAAIPSSYIIPSGTKSITANGTGIDVTSYAAVDVAVSGGGSSWTHVASNTYTTTTTSTSASTVATWSTGDSSIWDASKIIYIKIRDTAGKRAGYFYGSDNFYMNFTAANTSSSTSAANGFIRIIWAYNTSSQFVWRYGYSTTGYGVYPDYIYSDGRVRIRRRYNSTYSLTIDGTYKVDVYILDTPDGVSPFA